MLTIHIHLKTQDEVSSQQVKNDTQQVENTQQVESNTQQVENDTQGSNTTCSMPKTRSRSKSTQSRSKTTRNRSKTTRNRSKTTRSRPKTTRSSDSPNSLERRFMKRLSSTKGRCSDPETSGITSRVADSTGHAVATPPLLASRVPGMLRIPVLLPHTAHRARVSTTASGKAVSWNREESFCELVRATTLNGIPNDKSGGSQNDKKDQHFD